MRQRHYKGEVGPARWYTIVDLETLPVRRDRTHRPVGTWLSLVEHSLGVRGVGSSNLPVPTKIQPSAFSPQLSVKASAWDFLHQPPAQHSRDAKDAGSEKHDAARFRSGAATGRTGQGECL